MSVVIESRYAPRGACRELFLRHEPEVVLSGAAGTGKSRACLEKLNACAEKHPKMRGLILRKHREHLSESALVTFERDVLPDGHPAKNGGTRNTRREYRYPNGSVITVAGIYSHGAEQAQRIMSAEYDLIFVQEATDLSLDEWEKLGTRLRSGILPYQQLIADCNPASPSHWLYQRAQSGKLILLSTRHEDNPRLYGSGNWTVEGLRYLAQLDQLSGVRRERFRFGRWVQAEGAVYDLDESVHVIDSLPADWRENKIYLSVDFGFRNPLVAQVWSVDADNRLLLVREWYETGRLVEDVARELREWLDSLQLQPDAVICDHDAEGRATLEKYVLLKTRAADKQIGAGIERVQARLRVDETGQPGLRIYRNALMRLDPSLRESGAATCTLDEFGIYSWDTRSGGQRETPVKQSDHGMDALRYIVSFLDSGRRVVKWVY